MTEVENPPLENYGLVASIVVLVGLQKVLLEISRNIILEMRHVNLTAYFNIVYLTISIQLIYIRGIVVSQRN